MHIALYKKTKTIVLSLLLYFLLTSCEKEGAAPNIPLSCGFVTSEMLIEVTAETKSFRIDVRWPIPPQSNYNIIHHSNIYIVENATTAIDKSHFVNTPGEGMAEPETIGEFWILCPTILGEEEKGYKDVTIIPENITEQVVITYSTSRDRTEGSPIEDEGGLFNQLTVILKPKTSK